MGFTKLDSEIIDSSIWDENSNVLKVFIAFWTKSNPQGVVNATYNAMFRTANLCDKNKKPLPVKEFDNALKVLMEKDDTSRSKEHDGRRIIRLEESKWLITTYQKRRDYTYSDNPESIRKRKYRENKKLKKDGTNKRDTSQSVPGHSASASLYASLYESFKKEYVDCTELLVNRVSERRQIKVTEALLKKWTNIVKLMVKRDKRSIEDIKALINECHDMPENKDGFTWANNILSMQKLRLQWDKGNIGIGMTKKSGEEKKLPPPKDAYEAYCRTTSSPSEMILNRLISAWKQYNKADFENYKKIPDSNHPKFSDYMKQVFWIGKKYPPKVDAAKFIKKVKEYFESLK